MAPSAGWFCVECGTRTEWPGACPRDGNLLQQIDGLLGRAAGNYTLVARLGAGGMGEVMSGINPQIGARVAIKVLNAMTGAGTPGVERFRTEARAANRVEHDGVVKIIDAGQLDDGRAYLVMEQLDGESLADAMMRARLPIERVLDVVDGILAVVAAAHAKQTVHRDLKPGNVFLATSGRIRVLDFGIAKLLDEATSMTRIGAMIGTPGYMAPEQIRGNTVDPRADLYAIGVILFELLTGTRPYTGTSPFASAQAHVTAPLPRLPAGFAPALDAVVTRALAKAPAERFSSAEDMRTALRVASSPPPSRSRQRWWLAAVGASALAVTIVAGVAVHHDASPPVAPAVVASPAVDVAVAVVRAVAVDASVVVDAVVVDAAIVDAAIVDAAIVDATVPVGRAIVGERVPHPGRTKTTKERENVDPPTSAPGDPATKPVTSGTEGVSAAALPPRCELYLRRYQDWMFCTITVSERNDPANQTFVHEKLEQTRRDMQQYIKANMEAALLRDCEHGIGLMESNFQSLPNQCPSGKP